jgi:hypothetical protein
MIKKFDEYIKENYEGDTEVKPDVDTPTKPSRPERPSIIPTEKPSVEPGPLATAVEEEEVEDSVDFYQNKLEDLADKIDGRIEGNKVIKDDEEIIFPSETNMYHVGRRKFKTAEEVEKFLDRTKK